MRRPAVTAGFSLPPEPLSPVTIHLASVPQYHGKIAAATFLVWALSTPQRSDMRTGATHANYMKHTPAVA